RPSTPPPSTGRPAPPPSPSPPAPPPRPPRRSTLKQGESLKDQTGWAERVAAAEGLALARVFHDDDVQGDQMRRPGLDDLLAFADQEFFAGRQFSALVVWDLDRLSRSSSAHTMAVLSRLLDA